MQKKRSIRFRKWLLKAVVSYAAFIAVGQLLSLVPVSRLGLSKGMFLNLRMFFMLFGPIYLTLIVKIILTFIADTRGKAKDTSEENRGILFAFTALLLFANLSDAESVSKTVTAVQERLRLNFGTVQIDLAKSAALG